MRPSNGKTSIAGKVLTVPQAAKVLGLTKQRVYQLIEEEKLPTVPLMVKVLGIPADALLEWRKNAPGPGRPRENER